MNPKKGHRDSPLPSRREPSHSCPVSPAEVDRIKDRDLRSVEPGGPAVLEAHRDFGVSPDAPHDLLEREPAAGVVEREVVVGDGAIFCV